MKTLSSISAALALLSVVALRAEDWPQWRGPHFNGSSNEKNLPEKWSKEDALWKVELPGPGASTPVILGDHVFVTAADPSSKTLRAICLDRKTGKEVWNKIAGEGTIQNDDKSNFAAPSAIATPDMAIFFFSNGALIAYDHSGKELWSRNITRDYGDFSFQWTFSSSPMLSGGKLYLQVLQRDTAVRGRGGKDGKNASYLLAMDPKTGKTLWRHVRPTEAVAESQEAYSTPIPCEYNGRSEILIMGGDCITGHDPATGKELWRWGTWNPRKISHWRLVPSPVAGGGVALACAPKGDPVYAVKLGLNGKLSDDDLAWTSAGKREISTDVPTPLFYQDDFFVVSDVRKSLSRVEPATGKIKWTVELPGRKKFEASPTGADGKIYMQNFGGEVVVADAETGKILGISEMGKPGDDMIRSSVAVADGNLYIKTNDELFCVGKK
jgi:outer membrane protein assembly factor BamB